MRAICLSVIAATLAAVALGGAVNQDDCDFTAAVRLCSAKSSNSTTSCEHWNCLALQCQSEFHTTLANDVCAGPTAQVVVRPPQEFPAAAARDGSDLSAAKKAHHHKKHHHNHVNPPPAPAPAPEPHHKKNHVHGGQPPQVNSPCLNVKAQWKRSEIQGHLYKTAMDVYNQRAHETYSEDATARWVGIHNHVCPSSVPRTSDCSSTVTWIYWTLFGKGNDFLNGENWSAGYTGTLVEHGTSVSTNEADLQIGDLCFYYQPMHHVAIYVGNGLIVSHGMDPVGHYNYRYAPLDYCRRYI